MLRTICAKRMIFATCEKNLYVYMHTLTNTQSHAEWLYHALRAMALSEFVKLFQALWFYRDTYWNNIEKHFFLSLSLRFIHFRCVHIACVSNSLGDTVFFFQFPLCVSSASSSIPCSTAFPTLISQYVLLLIAISLSLSFASVSVWFF